VTPDGKLSISHDPIPALGWPAMTMDLDVSGVDTGMIPLEAPVTFDLATGEDGMFTIVAVRAENGGAMAMTQEPEPMPMTEAAPKPEAAMAPPITVEGTIKAVNAETGMATIAHGPIAEIGMPGMTMGFAIGQEVDPAALPLGEELMLTFARPDGMTMVLESFAPRAKPMRATGTINSVDEEAGTANITHGPLAAIGMPGMTMDFALSEGVDAANLPVGQETGLLILQGPDMSLSLAGIEEIGQ
jgi:Cu(I)/Ag(I) efflux system membrane fusion protein